jgi:hypothetical protein
MFNSMSPIKIKKLSNQSKINLVTEIIINILFNRSMVSDRRVCKFGANREIKKESRLL